MVPYWRVKSSSVRQSKIYKCPVGTYGSERDFSFSSSTYSPSHMPTEGMDSSSAQRLLGTQPIPLINAECFGYYWSLWIKVSSHVCHLGLCYVKGCHLSCFFLFLSSLHPVLPSVQRQRLASAVRFNFFLLPACSWDYNSVADAPFRFHWQDFRRLVPESQSLPVSHHLSCWRNGPTIFRATVPVLSGPRLSCFHSQILLIWSEEFHQPLCSNRQTASQWLPLLGRRMDLMPVCLFSDRIG